MAAQLRIALWLAVSSEAQAKEDKVSLKEQERCGREWVAAQPNATLVKVFHWDGYSRSETDVLTAYEDFANQGRYEYHELRRMWQEKAFDVLWVYVHDRLARSPALYAQVMSNVVKSGAKIFSLADGWIDENNVDTFLVIGSFSASGDIKKLVNRRRIGIRGRAKRGLKVSSKTHIAYREIRDPSTGKVTAQVPDESLHSLWQHVADLLLEGVGWPRIEQELYQRYGHVHPVTGKPFGTMSIRGMIHGAPFWGHTAQNYRDPKSKNGQKSGTWLFDESEPVPEGVVMFRNTHPPIYTGELAEKVKAELRRRTLIVGGRRPHNTAAFSGLLICHECGYFLAMTRAMNQQVYRSWRCYSHFSPTSPRKDCSARKQINEKRVKAWFDEALAKMLELGDPNLYFAEREDNAIPARLAEVTLLLTQNLIAKRRVMSAIQTVDDTEPAFKDYTDEMAVLGRKRESLEQEQLELERESNSSEKKERLQAYGELVNIGLPAFWELPERQINQLLLRLFGDWKAEVEDGEIKWIVRVNHKKMPRRV